MHSLRSQSGFSLVELSIVLVILGLLTGGILGGQALIRAAELRSLTVELERLSTATYSFRDKYFGMPGDITNATAFWGDQATGVNACPSPSTPDGSPGTCNGNGDGQFSGGDLGENLRALQQLALAGLIEGSYTGIPSASNNVQLAGENVVRARLPNAGIWFRFWGPQYGRTGNHLRVGSMWVAPDLYYWDGVATSEETWNLDTKMDDGHASLGRIIAHGSVAGPCTTGNFTDPAGSSNYQFSDTSRGCTIHLWID